MFRIKRRNFIKFYIIFYPICDMLYTLCNLMGWSLPINPSQLIRTMVLLLMATSLRKKKHIYLLLLAVAWIGLCTTYNIRAGVSVSFTADVAFMLKIISNLIYFSYFIELLKKDVFSTVELLSFIVWSGYIPILSVLLSYLGIGLVSYGGSDRYGVKGLFTIQSTLTAYLLMLLPLYYDKFKKIISIPLILLILCLFSIGSKTGVLGTVLVYLILWLFEMIHKRGKTRIQVVTYLLLIAGSVTVGINLMKKYVMYLINLYNKKKYYYNLESFLLSNRNDQVYAMKNGINAIGTSDSKIKGLIFGYGYSGAARIMQMRNPNIKMMERDLHTIYYYCGIPLFLVFVIGIIAVVLCIFRINIKYKCSNQRIFILSLISCLAIAYGWLGGHVFTEAMNQFYFWIIVACLLKEIELVKHQKRINFAQGNNANIGAMNND